MKLLEEVILKGIARRYYSLQNINTPYLSLCEELMLINEFEYYYIYVNYNQEAPMEPFPSEEISI